MPKSFQPVSGFDLPRFAGVPTFMRLPYVSLDDKDINQVQVGLIGTPWDTGTTNRPGPRHGPRQLRDYSTMIRAQNSHTDIRPFELATGRQPGTFGKLIKILYKNLDLKGGVQGPWRGACPCTPL